MACQSLGNPARFPQPILLLGTTGVFTAAVFDRLLAAGVPLAGLVIPASSTGVAPGPLPPPDPAPDELPLLDSRRQPSAVQQAWRAGLPIMAAARPDDPNFAAWLAEQAPAVVVVACFPWRIPAKLLSLAPLGFLNVHPSRLPAYRGPVPLFWMLRAGDQEGGVTVHWMDATLDSGDLARQVPVNLPDGATGPELDVRLGEAGGNLLVATLAALAVGKQPRTPQPPSGSYHGWPTSGDFRLETHWPAQRAYNFLRGTEEWGRPYTLEAGGHNWRLHRAVGWDPAGVLSAPVMVEPGGVLQVQFAPGVVTVQGEVILDSI
jgi:methionyl-tRNA formyltransferase